MTPTVDFYFGVASRYSYLAATQIEALSAEAGCVVRWRPLYSGALIAKTGASPFRGTPLSGQYEWPYRQDDAASWADYYGIPFREPSDENKFNAELLTRVAVACTAADQLGRVVPYAMAVYRAIFVDDLTPLDDAALADIAVRSGLDRDRFETLLNDPATVEALEATTDEAHRRGAFGVPTFFLGDRMFWGNDRLPVLKHFILKQKSARPIP